MGYGRVRHSIHYQIAAGLRSAVAEPTVARLLPDRRMPTDALEQFLPHRPPMLLVDEIVSRDDSSIVCRKTFHDTDFFVQGHFPGTPIVPGVIQCECCLQAGAVLLSQLAKGNSDAVPVATRMDNVKFKRMIRPGDTVDIHVTLNEQVSNAFFLTGKMLLAGKVAARLDFACSLTVATPPATDDSNQPSSATDSGATS